MAVSEPGSCIGGANVGLEGWGICLAGGVFTSLLLKELTANCLHITTKPAVILHYKMVKNIENNESIQSVGLECTLKDASWSIGSDALSVR